MVPQRTLPLNNLTVYKYKSDRNEWSKLPPCPNGSSFAIAIVNGDVTAIGGQRESKPINDLTSLVQSAHETQWSKRFPPMPTCRYDTATVCTIALLVVVGGRTGVAPKAAVSKVEVMDTWTLQWSTASSLPSPFTMASATVCDDILYVLGGENHKRKAKRSVFACSLELLKSSQEPIGTIAQRVTKAAAPFQLASAVVAMTKSKGVSRKQATWRKAAKLPVTHSTAVTCKGRVVAIGGEYPPENYSIAVQAYVPDRDRWDVISHMPGANARSKCLVAVLPGEKLMVVGGGDNNLVLTASC